MKAKILFTVILMILPMLLAPVQAGNELMVPQNSSNFSEMSIQNDVPTLATANEPHLDQWRGLLESAESPRFDYTINRGSFSVNDAEDFLQPAVALQPDGKPIGDLKGSKSIHIDSEKDFNKYDGSGTIDDPYVISGYYVTDSKNNLLQIENINAYVLVTGNVFDGEGNGNAAILINNAPHITIEKNNITAAGVGLVASNADYLTVTGNHIYTNLGDSLTVTSSSYVEITNNLVEGNGEGAIVAHSSRTTVSLNVFRGNQGHGLALVNSNLVTITGNMIYNNGGDGVFFQDSDNNTVTANDIHNNGPGVADTTTNSLSLNFMSGLNTGDQNLAQIDLDLSFGGNGLFLDPSLGNTVSNNNIYENAAMGILLEFSNSTLIDNNVVTNNGLSGVFFIDSNDNTISNNEIGGNGASASLSSALEGLNPLDYITLLSFGGNGLFLDPSFGNTISGNTITNNPGDGIILEFSGDTSIHGNTIDNNGLNGIFFIDSDGNSITENIVTNNGNGASASLATAGMDPLEIKLMLSFGGNGLFLDPSEENIVDNNVIMNNEANGVFFLESSLSDITSNQILGNGLDGVALVNSTGNNILSNLIDGSGSTASSLFTSDLSPESFEMYLSFGGNGLFLDPSPGNTISENIITNSAANGIYFLDTNSSSIDGNTITDSGANGIFLQDSSHNTIANNAIDNNGATVSALAASLDLSFGGNGLFLDPSHYNVVYANNISRSTGDGIFSESSTNTHVEFNRLIDNIGYGINLDDFSVSSTVTDNNFVGNDGIGSQGRDDGTGNSVFSNWWSDGNNSDENFDGIADYPYKLDGDAETTDSVPSNIPEGLNFYNVTMESSPTKLNADSEGSPLTLKVYLSDGFRALNISLEDLWLNKTINPFKSHIIDIQTFTVTFNRTEVNALVNSLGEDVPFFTVLELTGLMNDGLLDITGYDTIEVNQTDDTTTVIFVAGLSSMVAIPAFGQKSDSKLSKILQSIKEKIFN